MLSWFYGEHNSSTDHFSYIVVASCVLLQLHSLASFSGKHASLVVVTGEIRTALKHGAFALLVIYFHVVNILFMHIMVNIIKSEIFILNK